jgi:signal transduction histidine kinase
VIFRSASASVDVSASANALRSAVENVIRNSIRFSPAGSEVSVDLRIVKQMNGLWVQVRVSDCGPGVPEDSLSAIFQPFFQVHHASVPLAGNGLGLAIAFEAVRMHRGTILARNLPPSGLEVQIEIPLDLAAATMHRPADKKSSTTGKE